MSTPFADLNDDELRAEMISHGLSIGPVTPSTRNVYIKKLVNLRASQAKQAVPKSSRRSQGSSAVAVSPSAQRNPSPKATNRRSSPVRQSSPKSHRRSSPSIYRPVERTAPEVPLQRPSAVHQSSPTTYRPPNLYERITSDVSPPRPSAVPQSSPRTYRRGSPSLYKPPERITPDVSFTRPTDFSPQKINFDTSAHDNDDDHMEFSKYIPRKNRSFKESSKSSAPVAFNPAFLGGLAFTAAVIAFMFFPDTVHGGISKGSDYINHAIMLGFKYAIIPFLILGLVAALCFAGYYVFQIRKKRIAIYEEKKQKLIKDILKAVYNAPRSGIPVKQLRDKMIPAYKRTKEELLLWNKCEAFVKTYDTRVRAEERILNSEDEIVEHFVWIGSTLNDDFGD